MNEQATEEYIMLMVYNGNDENVMKWRTSQCESDVTMIMSGLIFPSQITLKETAIK